MSRIIRFLLGKIYYWIFVFSIALFFWNVSAFCLFSRFPFNFYYAESLVGWVEFFLPSSRLQFYYEIYYFERQKIFLLNFFWWLNASSIRILSLVSWGKLWRYTTKYKKLFMKIGWFAEKKKNFYYLISIHIFAYWRDGKKISTFLW